MKKIRTLLLLFPMIIFAQSNFDKAEKLFKDGKYDQAQTIFENLLKENPSNLKTIEYLGDIAYSNKSWDVAIRYYQKLKQLKPNEADYYYKYGGALGTKAKFANKFIALGMIGDVRKSFEKAIELDPKHIDARWALVSLYIQLPGIVGGSESKAIKYSNELLKLSPVDGFLTRGTIEEYFKRYSNAEQQYKKAIAAGSTKTGAKMLANLYKNKMNQPEKAKLVLQEIKS